MATRGLWNMWTVLGPNVCDSRGVMTSQGGYLMGRMARVNENKDFSSSAVDKACIVDLGACNPPYYSYLSHTLFICLYLFVPLFAKQCHMTILSHFLHSAVCQETVAMTYAACQLPNLLEN